MASEAMILLLLVALVALIAALRVSRWERRKALRAREIQALPPAARPTLIGRRLSLAAMEADNRVATQAEAAREIQRMETMRGLVEAALERVKKGDE